MDPTTIFMLIVLVILIVVSIQMKKKKEQQRIEERESLKVSIPKVSVSKESKSDPIDQLKELKNLLDEGLITQAEFDSKREELLGRL